MPENKPTFIQAIKAAQAFKTKISLETAATIQQKKLLGRRSPPTSPPQESLAAVDK